MAFFRLIEISDLVVCNMASLGDGPVYLSALFSYDRLLPAIAIFFCRMYRMYFWRAGCYNPISVGALLTENSYLVTGNFS